MKLAKLSTLAVAAILAITAVTICTAGCSGSMAAPSPVQASTVTPYSDASAIGAYAIQFSRAIPNYGSVNDTDQGAISFDGAGNVQSGTTITRNYAGGSNACTLTPSGTYSISSSGSGWANITLTPTGTTPCQQTTSIQFTIQAAQQGQVILLQETDNQNFATGTAAKI